MLLERSWRDLHLLKFETEAVFHLVCTCQFSCLEATLIYHPGIPNHIKLVLFHSFLVLKYSLTACFV
jgi:hypothetical protein